MDDLRGLEAIFGVAGGKVEGRESSAFLPLVFRLHAPEGRLDFVITDYHDNTWEASRSVEQLQDLRDEVGIGGSWLDFVSYVKSAFSSGNVTLMLGGPAATALAGRGATCGKIVAQKCKGMPLVKLVLTKLSGVDASDRMADVAVHACRGWQVLSTELAAEQAEAKRLRLDVEAERLKASQLEEKIDALTGKKRKSAAKDSVAISDTVEQQQQQQSTKSKPKPRRVAPLSSRSKRKGTAIAEEDEDD